MVRDLLFFEFNDSKFDIYVDRDGTGGQLERAALRLLDRRFSGMFVHPGTRTALVDRNVNEEHPWVVIALRSKGFHCRVSDTESGDGGPDYLVLASLEDVLINNY